MNPNNITVNFGGKAYKPIDIDYIQTYGEYPILKVEASLSPSCVTAFNNVSITNVIFSPPATVVFWSDRTKTVVKCLENEVYDPEKGIAMAISKKMIGDNKYEYYNTFLHWMNKYNKEIVNE